MIDTREILEAASSFSLLPNVVEKDYVLGWILAGINANEELAEGWVFKGGTCLKKCYFETYRFSEDLDFTLRNEEHLDEEFLQTVFEEVIAWVTEQSGLNIPADQLEFDIFANARGRPNCQDRKSTRLNSSHGYISYAVFCLKKKKKTLDVTCLCRCISTSSVAQSLIDEDYD